jgi:hypothetical protein
MWQMVTVAVFHSVLLLFGFQWPTAADAGMLILSGIAWAIGQYLWTQALRLADAIGSSEAARGHRAAKRSGDA